MCENVNVKQKHKIDIKHAVDVKNPAGMHLVGTSEGDSIRTRSLQDA